MTDEQLRALAIDNLCTRDPRSEFYRDMVAMDPEWPNDVSPPRTDCYCDCCFYGRDKLAMAILELLDRDKRPTAIITREWTPLRAVLRIFWRPTGEWRNCCKIHGNRLLSIASGCDVTLKQERLVGDHECDECRLFGFISLQQDE